MSDDRLPEDDDFLDALLRAHAPPPVADDGFTARTMQAIPNLPGARLDAARALVLEQRRYAAQQRLWRWAVAGIAAGVLLLAVAMACAPEGGLAVDVDGLPPARDWLPLWALAMAGAVWYAWTEFRSS